MSGLFFAPAAFTEMGQLKALNRMSKWVSGAMESGSLKDDTVVADATIAVCPDGSRISRLKRTRVEHLGATVEVEVGVGVWALGETDGAEAGGLRTGVALLLPFD